MGDLFLDAIEKASEMVVSLEVLLRFQLCRFQVRSFLGEPVAKKLAASPGKAYCLI